MSTRFRGIKRITALMLIMMMVIGSMPGWFAAGEGKVSAAGGLEFAGGSGAEEDPYLISNAQMLDEVRGNLNASYKLIADIDLSEYASGEGWQPIGNWDTAFAGNFDGNGYTIANLKSSRTNSDEPVGLFGYIYPGMVSNVILENIDVGNGDYVGGLAGMNGGTITNSGVITGSVSGYAAGGLVGYNESSITNSFFAGSLSGAATNAGGMVGFNDGTINNSFATGSISGQHQTAGGLVGRNEGLISDSYYNGSVNGETLAGGLVGFSRFRIVNSYATGAVTGDGRLGGLAGNNDWAINSFFDSDTTGQTSSGTGGGTGLTTAAMMLQSSYEGWDFEHTWTIDASLNNGYPYLQGSQLHIAYNGNGETDGDVPSAETAYVRGATVSVFGNIGNLAKTGYTFMGWNTLADGTGDSYSAGDAFAITASKTLFAIWASAGATMASSVGTVSTGGTSSEMITVPNGTTLSALKAAITPVAGATYEAYEADGTTLATTLATGNKIIVTAEDGITHVTYTVTVMAPSTPPGGGGNGGNTPPSSGGGGNSGSAPAQAPGKVTSTKGSLTLPVGIPGQVSLEEKLTITVPAGAVNQELKITMTTLSDTTNIVVNQEVFASEVFEVLKNIPGNFTKPVTLTFAFDASLVKSGQRAGIFYFDEVNKAWVEVQGSKTSGNSIAVEVDHFTKFAVLVVGSATELPGTTPADSEVSVSDIAGHWAEVQIQQAIQAGIVNGYTDGTFKPGHTITRSEFTVMLMNALNAQEAGAELAFTDQAKIGTWAQTAVAQAVQAGIISGYTDGTFQPNANITRAEMAMMIGKAFELSLDGSGVTTFADDEAIPAWAKHAVATLQARGVVRGTGANTFNPRTQTTRAEAVVMLLNMLNVAEGQNVQ
ncbi:S-layer homology domain-containing protein [Paenibacillus sp. FSL H8-0317]|uniref:S-layer homology domain-containing protein n=1 Tax=Paenibacillus sp. FSL H8-0317 TaxID=2921385 RepID=UPI00324B0EE3